MGRALALAGLALGRTSPNPAVGAVIVRDGVVVGEGFTQPPGGPHAEVVALRQAGSAAYGATLYVTLEPCCHYGRTPPCTQAIIGAGIGAVSIAARDPNPIVHGGGFAELEQAGILVRVGDREEQALRLNEVFVHYITTGRPFVSLKWAMTLDGKIASHSGHSRWVTGTAARQRVHQLRDVSDAIVVGCNTVIADDPELTVRLAQLPDERPPAWRVPLRVVVDSRGRAPLEARVFSDAWRSSTLVATTAASPDLWRDTLGQRGVAVVVLPDREGRVDLAALLAALAERERIAVLVEGGGVLAAGFIEAGLRDKVYAFVAPKIVGGREAPSPVAGTGYRSMDDALRLADLTIERLGEDVLVIGYPLRTPANAETPQLACLGEQV